MAVTVYSVKARSLAAKAGIKASDIIARINGNEINDVLDYKFYLVDTHLCVELQDRTVRIKKEEYQEIGIEFETYLMDKERHCKNNCIFCFINQLPKGMRSALYFKDDDARLSFLQGNYITLTNLSDKEVDRIIKMKLCVNVSVHTTNEALRAKMTCNPEGGTSLQKLYKMAEAGISLNCQLVLCPTYNDGIELLNSLKKLTSYGSVVSIACVPVGLSKHRQGLPHLVPFTKETAADVLDIVESVGEKLLKERGSRVVFAADEFYLKAERSFPNYDYYEDFPQFENGLGMWVSLMHEFSQALADTDVEEVDGNRHKTLATGIAAAPLIKELSEKAAKKYNLTLDVVAITNNFFGENITVAGLTTGTDLLEQLLPLKGKLGEELLLPAVMINPDGNIFLDDVTLETLETAIGVPIKLVKNDGFDLLEAIVN